MARLSMPDLRDLTPEQAEVVAEVVSGKRGKVPAPMIAWLRNAELARRGQQLGELLRFDTTLEPVLRELAIIICGRHWTSHHEWTAHKKLALEAGLDPATIADIAAGRPDPYLRSLREETVFKVATTLLSQGKIDADLYRQGIATLGKTGMVELVAVLGYYCLVALTLNAFEIGLPDSFAQELAQGHALDGQ